MVRPHLSDGVWFGRGAYSYRGTDATCAQAAERGAPADWKLVRALPSLFPDASIVHDVGGGPGTYLTSFRNLNRMSEVGSLVTVEPRSCEI